MLSVSDGIARIYGLNNVQASEMDTLRKKSSVFLELSFSDWPCTDLTRIPEFWLLFTSLGSVYSSVLCYESGRIFLA